MSTKILLPPLVQYFFPNLYSCATDVLLAAPYVKLSVVEKIVKTLKDAGTIDAIKLMLLTNVSTANFINGSSDSKAVELILQEIPNANVIGIGNLHAKCYIFDKKISIITSGNLTPSGMVNNLEMGVQIDDSVLSSELHNTLSKDYGNAGKKILLDEIGKISKSISEYYVDNAARIEKLDKEVEIFNSSIEKFISPRVRIKISEIVAPSMTSIVSSGQRINTTIAGSPDEKPIPQLLLPKVRRKTLPKKTYLNIDNDWFNMYDVLCRFRDANPKYWPVKSDKFDGYDLGIWCADLRKKFKNKLLSTSEIALLKKINFEFDIDNNLWAYYYNLLSEYRDEFPKQWPNTRELFHGMRLGKWCKLQRQEKEKRELKPYRVNQLEAIGFIWNLDDAYWGQTIALLKEFRKQHPSRWPYSDERFKEYDLFRWCCYVEEKYLRNELSSNRIEELQMMDYHFGTILTNERERLWKTMLFLLKQYLKENGRIPANNIIYHGKPLGSWTEKQRRKIAGAMARHVSYSDKEAALVKLGLSPLFPSDTRKLAPNKSVKKTGPISPLKDVRSGRLESS